MGPRNHTFPSKRGAPRFSSFSLDPLQHSAIQKSLSKDSTGKEKDVEHGAARRWLRWMHKNGLKAWIVPCIVVTTTWIKLCTSLGSYSGELILSVGKIRLLIRLVRAGNAPVVRRL